MEDLLGVLDLFFYLTIPFILVFLMIPSVQDFHVSPTLQIVLITKTQKYFMFFMILMTCNNMTSYEFFFFLR